MSNPIPPFPNSNLPQPPATAPPPSSSNRCPFSIPLPAMRVTTEFDSDSSVFFHKISCRLFDRLAKLKLSFQNDRGGEIASPQLGFLTKNFAVLYDVESRNALLKGSIDLASFLQVRATHDVKVYRVNSFLLLQRQKEHEYRQDFANCTKKTATLNAILFGKRDKRRRLLFAPIKTSSYKYACEKSLSRYIF